MCLALGVAMAEGAEDETYVGRVGAAVAEGADDEMERTVCHRLMFRLLYGS